MKGTHIPDDHMPDELFIDATLDPHEKLKTIVVTNGEWSIENGIMTPTLKIKRNVLESRYEDRIENWYDSKEKVQWE